MWRLSQPLLRLSDADLWTLADACEGVQVLGATGSGKTSGSLAALARAYLRAGMGGLVLTSKPEERRIWERYAEQTGRRNDLIVVEPDGPHRFNFMEYEVKRSKGGGNTENLVELLSLMVEIAEGKAGISDAEPFWPRAMKELLRNAIDLLTLTGEAVGLESLMRLVATAPIHPKQVDDPAWRDHKKALCPILLKKAEAIHTSYTPRQKHDYDMAWRYWCVTFPALSDRTRSSIVATFTSTADILLHGIAWELLAQDTTIVPEVAFKGAIILIDLPIQNYHELGRLAQGMWKLMFQRAAARRVTTDGDRPVFIVADESHNFVSSMDYRFQAVARSAKCCTIYATQSVTNYRAALGKNAEAQADALLALFATKIFHANGDHTTNQWAADAIAQDWQNTFGGSGQHSEKQPGSNTGASFNEGMHYQVPPIAFTRLRKGGEANDRMVDAVLFQSGRSFAGSGEAFTFVAFEQG